MPLCNLLDYKVLSISIIKQVIEMAKFLTEIEIQIMNEILEEDQNVDLTVPYN